MKNYINDFTNLITLMLVFYIVFILNCKSHYLDGESY